MDNLRPNDRSTGSFTLPTPVLAVKQAICFSCWKDSTRLSKCTACKRVAYCSTSCQKQDWSNGHKKTCKILTASNKRRTKTTRTNRTWRTYRDEKVREIAGHVLKCFPCPAADHINSGKIYRSLRSKTWDLMRMSKGCLCKLIQHPIHAISFGRDVILFSIGTDSG
jgi:hypothetical protein